MIPAGLRTWSKRVRPTARGEGGEGIPGWHHRAISAYTWCVTEKGPHRKWLHKIGKEEKPGCQCKIQTGQSEAHSGGVHEVDRVGEGGGERTKHGRVVDTTLERQREGKIVETQKETEEPKGEKMESFICSIYEISTDAGKLDATISHLSNVTVFLPLILLLMTMPVCLLFLLLL